MSGSLHRWYSRPALDSLADRRTVVRGEIQLGRLTRLNELSHFDSAAEGPAVSASLRFGDRHEGWLTVELAYEAKLPLICQRCLETFVYPASARLGIGLLETASMESFLPEGYEPVVLEDDRLMPAQLIEDELIISMPLVPRHEFVEECGSLVHDEAALEDRGVTLSRAHKANH